MLTALILDDELLARNCLYSLLIRHCKQLGSFFLAEDIAAASEIFRNNTIDILFLDINMGQETGFDLLQQIHCESQAIIFVSAYEEYGLKALKVKAVDYLLKPIDIDELVGAVDKAISFLSKATPAQTEQMCEPFLQQIVINHLHGFELFHFSQILFVAAEGSYTAFYLQGARKVIASKQLGFYEEVLTNNDFFRSHKSFIINLRHMKGFSSKNGYRVILSEAHEVPVSRRKLPEFLGLYKR